MLLPVVAGRIAAESPQLSSRLLGAATLATIIPDLDVIAFAFGISYSDAFGHRGFTHSITFALIFGTAAGLYCQHLKSSWMVAFWTIFLSMISHPLLDSLTNGGLGVALFWPVSDERHFLPWQPLEVSPIGARGFFTARGAQVLVSEFYWVVLPLFATAFLARLGQYFWRSRRKASL